MTIHHLEVFADKCDISPNYGNKLYPKDCHVMVYGVEPQEIVEILADEELRSLHHAIQDEIVKRFHKKTT